VAAAELARMLGNQSVFKSSHHEGPDYNIYTYAVNNEILLAVIFGIESKVGAVWLYAKQAASALAPLVEEVTTSVHIGEGMAAAVSAEMERMLDLEAKDGMDGRLMGFQEAIASGLLPAELWAGENEPPDENP